MQTTLHPFFETPRGNLYGVCLKPDKLSKPCLAKLMPPQAHASAHVIQVNVLVYRFRTRCLFRLSLNSALYSVVLPLLQARTQMRKERDRAAAAAAATATAAAGGSQVKAAYSNEIALLNLL